MSRNTDIDCILKHVLSILLTLFETLKIVLIKMAIILMMSAKLATLGLPKLKIFWKKNYDVIISVHDVTNKVLSRGSNYIVDVVMWSNFGNFLRDCLGSIIWDWH